MSEAEKIRFVVTYIYAGKEYVSEWSDVSADAAVSRLIEHNPHLALAAADVRATNALYYYYDKARALQHQVQVSEKAYMPDTIRERLRCCVDLAYILGVDSARNLASVLDRVVRGKYILTSNDSDAFSFMFTCPSGGFSGGLIYHRGSKEWGTHT
jgi:hypothetical protein